MIPITRKEKYINEIVGGGDTAPETPQTREEFFFAEILGEVIAPSPVTRVEKYLSAIARQYSGDLPTPITRIEYFLARAAGMEIETPIPITREEMLWDTYIPIKTIEGIPPLTFKAKKAGTLKNYRIYGNTETKTRSYSGSAPLSFPIVDGAVRNYRIYGNTENGESVGDKTANILPLSRTPITETHGDFLCEYDGLGTITLTTDKDNATTDDEFVIPLIQDFTIPVSIGQGGTGCLQINNDTSLSTGSNAIKFYYNGIYVEGWNLNKVNRTVTSYRGGANKAINAVSVVIPNGESSRKITIKPAFVENVTEQVPFEPYSYKLPITNNSETSNIYLDEPLRKVGDEAEYVDYAEQKWHRVRKNLINSSIYEIRNTGVEYTVNNDKSITANGSTSSNFSLLLVKVYLTKGSYIISGCPQNGSQNTYRCEIRDMVLISLAQDTGAGVTYSIVTDGYYYYSIRIAQNYVCDNLTFYPMIRKADIEDDTYEPYIENTEVDVTIPDLPAQSTSNSLSVGTAVQPSSVAVDVDEIVSCGDRTGNLFDGEFLQGYWAYADGVWVQANTWITTKKIPCKSSTTYAFSFNRVSRWYGFVWFDFSGNYISYNDKQNSSKIQYRSFSAVSPPNAAYMAINVAGYPETVSTIFPNDITDFMLVEGSTALPYEPYGYRVPVTVTNGADTQTTNLYLPEQIKMVGDEAEYIDYAEQKQHRVRKNLLQNTATSQTINGVTFTVNSDGSVTCNGKCVNNVAVLYIKRPTTFYDETIQYTLTGCPVGGAYNSTYALEYTNSVNQSKPDVGNGVSFTPYRKEFYPNACIRIVIFVGYTCDNLTFYPMIRKADIEDDTYEPYIENTEVDVTIPALPTLSGTNTLTVGTEVQPSNVYIKYEGAR